MCEQWDPPQLRAWIRGKWTGGNPEVVIAWVISEQSRGFSVAVYSAGDAYLLLPVDHAVPPDVLPSTAGVMVLAAVCRPASENVVPLARATGTGRAV